MKEIPLIFASASFLLLTACAQAPPPAPDTSVADAATVRASVDRFVASWNAGDYAAIAPHIAEDAILMQPDGPATRGRDAILQALPKGYDFETMVQTHTTDEVLVHGDYANAYGTWRVDPKPGVDAPAQSGKWTVLYKRNDGSWPLYRWMWNDDRAAATPAS